MLKMLSRVEGMPPETLAVGATFAGGGHAEFAASVEDGGLGVNVGLQVGHSAVRRFVMGDESVERAATADEVAEMAALVHDAMREGAVGFTSSQLDMHVTHDGGPVPSNLAAPEELIALAGALADFPSGAIEFISPHQPRRPFARRPRADAGDVRGERQADEHQSGATAADAARRVARRHRVRRGGAARAGARVYPQSATQQLQVFFALSRHVPVRRDARVPRRA